MSGKLVLALLVTFIVSFSVSPNTLAQDCNPPAITANTKNYNIFSPDQEMILGDLNFQRMSRDWRFISDQQIEAYLNELGQKLAKHLPATGLKFQFHLVDIPDANAFNTPGGYVFVSRKLIGFVINEDELAGVIAHELGHATVRHAASDFSTALKEILNVTQLGDRKDITEKYNLILERRRTKGSSRSTNHESAQQVEADRIGLFAMVAAGYDPNALTSLFERLFETKGKSGNWFSDIFGTVRPEQKRLRELIKSMEELPAQCRENRRATASSDFLNWQAEVVSFREGSRREQLDGLLWKKELNPGLRSDLSHFAVSSNGQYILAQDDFAITILTREPLEVVFQIPAPDARDATFTPDNQFVVFGTETLRFEKWSILEKRPVEVRELVVRRDCLENEFSPDGKFLACVDYQLNLNLIDTQSGKKVWEKKKFYELDFYEVIAWVSEMARQGARDNKTGFFYIEYSPDSQYLVVSRSSRFRFRFSVNLMTVAQSESTMVAVDLKALKPMSTGGDLKKVTRRAFVFLDSGRILGMPSDKMEDSGIFSFPDGKRQSKFNFGAQELILAGDPNYVIIKPLSNAKLGIFDVSKNSIVNGMNKVDASVWKNNVVFEGTSGKVMLASFHFNEEKQLIQLDETKAIDVPVAAIGSLSVAEISDNFEWLAISSKTRGGLWSLTSGDRKLFLRGFKGAAMANDGLGLGDFPKLDTVNHSLALMNPVDGSVNIIREIPEVGAQQYGRFVLVREPLKETKKADTKTNKTGGGEPQSESDKTTENSLRRDVRMSLKDIVKDQVVWTRDFSGPAPYYFFDKFSGRLIFYWPLGSAAGKDRLKADPSLAARAQEMGNKDDDYLLEIVDAFATKTMGTVLLETGQGSFDITSAYSEGNWLVLHDSTNRILAFSINDGVLQQRFFGGTAAISPLSNKIAIENYPGEVTIYDLANGDAEGRLIVSSGVAFVRFSLDGKRLFLLTDKQVAYSFDVAKIALKEAPLAQGF